MYRLVIVSAEMTAFTVKCNLSKDLIYHGLINHIAVIQYAHHFHKLTVVKITGILALSA